MKSTAKKCYDSDIQYKSKGFDAARVIHELHTIKKIVELPIVYSVYISTNYCSSSYLYQ